MRRFQHIFFAAFLLVADILSIFVPIGSLLFLVIVIFRPRWFYNMVGRVYLGKTPNTAA